MTALINITWPARLHLIVLGSDVLLYLTIRVFARRWHFCRSRA